MASGDSWRKWRIWRQAGHIPVIFEKKVTNTTNESQGKERYIIEETESFLATALGCLLSQLSLGFKLYQLHQIFNHHIALQLFAFFLGKRAVTLSLDEFVCSFSHLGRGMERRDLFRSGMIREKLCNISRGLCFGKHSHCLLLQQRMSHSDSLHGSFLTIQSRNTL